MSKKLVVPFIVLTSLIFSINTFAEVRIVDIEDNASFLTTQATIGTGEGSKGNYVVLLCSISDGEDNEFYTPMPLSWTLLDDDDCGGPFCTNGIWGGIVDDPGNQEITCSWDNETKLFVAASVRYSGVDIDDPLIDQDCNTGSGAILTAPSVETEAGSQVLRVFTFGAIIDEVEPGITNADDKMLSTNNVSSSTEEDFEVEAIGFDKVLVISGESQLVGKNGPTGEEVADLSEKIDSVDWKACTIAIRMTPAEEIPTVSEWGLIAMVGIMGATGVIVMRRKRSIA